MDIISRDDARQRGLKFFYSHEPCGRGHFAKRVVNSGLCVDCIKADRLFSNMVSNAKLKAKRLKVPFKLTRGDIERMLPDDGLCPILGIELKEGGGRGPKPSSPSLYRIDPAVGYVPQNLVVVSWLAAYLAQNILEPGQLRLAAAWLEKMNPQP